MVQPLKLDQLYKKCNLDLLPFKDTSTVEKFRGFFGQDRALEAMQFGVGMRRPGYNFFVMGNPHTGRFSFAMDMLKSVAKKEKKPADWVYVNNFEEGRLPFALTLPAGKAAKLKRENQELLEAIAVELPAAYESPSFQRKKSNIEKQFNALYDAALLDVEEVARSQSIALYREGATIGFTPISDGQAMDEAEFSMLPENERQIVNSNISSLEDLLNERLAQLPVWRRDAAERMKKLEKDTSIQAIEPLLSKLQSTYGSHSKLLNYYERMLKHLAHNAEDFLYDEKSGELHTEIIRRSMLQDWYGVNVIVNNDKTKGAAVVYEAHPTYENLFGRVEFANDMHSLGTSYQRIRPGALHKANGGYLLLDAEKLLEMPMVYSALKRALKATEIRIELPSADVLGANSFMQSPEPMALQVKVALVGSRNTYYVLQDFDPDFEKTFRVVVDFDEVIPRTDKSIRNYARLIKTLADQEGLAPFTRSSVARLIEHSSRCADDTSMLSSHIGDIVDLLCEADYKRLKQGEELVSDKHVNLALEAQQSRTGRLSKKIVDSIVNEVVLIHTSGEHVGKCNGLTVLQVGDISFGTPARITATVFPGNQGIVDIEREADLGQSIHSKGVLILSGYLGYKYAKDFPIKISANIALEQSYGAIDGDSASLAELCALISSLTQIPISQRFAITGSINQFGEVQAIGGANVKIEGFFEICKQRGFEDGPHGVIVPSANIRNMMLKQEVLDAVSDGLFAIYSVNSVDECLSILMNRCVGEIQENGMYPDGSINQSAVQRLYEMSNIRLDQ
jgi:predicted ATP-dependent protease